MLAVFVSGLRVWRRGVNSAIAHARCGSLESASTAATFEVPRVPYQVTDSQLTSVSRVHCIFERRGCGWERPVLSSLHLL